MARNEEKSQTMLNRFLQGKKDDAAGPKQRRPYLATECHDLVEADRWRQQIIREIGKKVMEIQNAGLGEHRLRDLNDEINKLIREKGHWEKRIVELGGPDYAKAAPKVQDSEGRDVGDASTGRSGGYRYFGAAKTLPGVRELFEKEPPKKVRRTRRQLYEHINGDYYGFRDEEDGVLERVEAVAEITMRGEALAEWEEQEAERREAYAGVAGGMDSATAADVDGPQFVAYVPLPDQKEIEQRVLDKKKAELLAKYTSEKLMQNQQEAKTLLNKR